MEAIPALIIVAAPHIGLLFSIVAIAWIAIGGWQGRWLLRTVSLGLLLLAIAELGTWATTSITLWCDWSEACTLFGQYSLLITVANAVPIGLGVIMYLARAKRARVPNAAIVAAAVVAFAAPSGLLALVWWDLVRLA